MHNLSEIKTFATGVIKEAGELLKEYFKKKTIVEYSKGGVDFATQADLEVDAFLRHRLSRQYPEASLLTEEATKDYLEFSEKENVWIIDPIDGTTNFSRGDDHFSISVALCDRGKVRLGIVYLPIENGGKLYVAQEGDSHASCNNKLITVSKTDTLEKASIGLDWAWEIASRQKTYGWLGKMLTVIRQPRSLGSASADLCLLADGTLDAYCNAGLKPWDVAAGTFILEKAGGKVTKVDGSQWGVFDPDLVTSNGVLHEKLLEILAE